MTKKHCRDQFVRLGLLVAALGGSTAAQEPGEDSPLAARSHATLTIHSAPRALADGAVVEDWPSFLGPRRDARCLESPIDTQFGLDGPTLLWEMNCGSGFSSPAVAGDRLVYTHRIGDETLIDCLEASTGKLFWRRRLSCTYVGRYIEDAGPRSTPEISGERVFVHAVDGQLVAFELATGEVLWEANTTKDFESQDGFFGVVSSPLVVGGQLIQNIGAPGGPCVAGFDVATGEFVWGAGTRWGASCASPIVAEVHGKRKLYVVAGGDSRPPTGGLLGIDLETHALEFEYDYRSRTYESVNGATPLIADNRIYLTASYGLGSRGLALDAKGGVKQLWKNRHMGQQFSSQVFLDGVIYGIDGVSGRVGSLVAIDPESGQELWREDLSFEQQVEDKGTEKTFTFSVGEGSLLVVGDQLLVLGDYGNLVTLRPGKQGAKVLAQASLFQASESWTPLVISHGLLYVCQNSRARFGASTPRLLCYDLRGEGSR